MTEIDFNAELVLQEEQGASPITDRLIRALADEYSVQFYSQVAHWNVTGPDFQQLHALFAESYAVCNESIDTIAEQARILGATIPLSLSALLSTSAAPLPVSSNSPAAYVEQLQRCHEMLKGKWDSIAADSGSDAGLNDLAGQMSAKHAKMAWKFRSTGGQQ